MSTWLVVVLVVFGYVVVGLGSARLILARRVKFNVENHGGPNYDDFDVSGFAICGGVLWPLGLPLLAISPAVRVIGPAFGRWFMAPAHRAEVRR